MIQVHRQRGRQRGSLIASRLGRWAIGLFAVVALVTPTAAMAADEPQAEPLVIDFATASVTEADGTPLQVAWSSTDPGESIGTATLSNGETAEITKHSALPVPADLFEEPESSVTPGQIEQAREYPGVLPEDMVPTDFVESDQPIVETGELPTVPAEASDFELSALTAVTETTVSYAWAGEGSTYEITKDGSLFTTTTTPSFSDFGLAPGSTVDYEITSFNSEGAILATRSLPVTTQGGQITFAPLTYQPYISQAIYRTFIADNRVTLGFWETWGCGQAFQPNRSFGGDNRSFHVPDYTAPWDGVSSRTSVALNVNWDNPYPYNLIWVKAVGTTTLYDGSTLIDSRTASDAGIQITDASSTTSYAQARVNHDVGNPFCAAGSIKYNVMFRWYRNGTFEVVGWRQPVPHHEIYGGWDNGVGNATWHTFGQFTNEGFGCLTGSCGNEDMYITRTY